MNYNDNVTSRFGSIVSRTGCLFARTATVTYADDWQSSSGVWNNAVALAPQLQAFVRREAEMALDMFVVEVNDSRVATLAGMASVLNTVLLGLRHSDSANLTPLTEGIDTTQWEFSFAGCEFFLLTFAPFYQLSHPRRSPFDALAYICFQPDHSFDRQGISSQSPRRKTVVEAVRARFTELGMAYDPASVDGTPKASRYLKPLSSSDPAVRWWEAECLDT